MNHWVYLKGRSIDLWASNHFLDRVACGDIPLDFRDMVTTYRGLWNTRPRVTFTRQYNQLFIVLEPDGVLENRDRWKSIWLLRRPWVRRIIANLQRYVDQQARER